MHNVSAHAMRSYGVEEPNHNLQVYEAGDLSLETIRMTQTVNDQSTRRKARKLSCLSLRYWKSSEEGLKRFAEKEPNEKLPVYGRHDKKRQFTRQSSGRGRDNRLSPKAPAMGFVERIRVWLRSSQSEHRGKLSDPLFSGTRSSVIPIHPGPSTPHYRIPFGSGAAARQSAAARNSRVSQRLNDDAFDLSRGIPPVYVKVDPRFSLLGQSLSRDGESGVELEKKQAYVDSQDDMSLIVRKDPFQCLPPELTATVLSYLNCISLARVELVSRAWSLEARQSHAWREIFRTETFKERHIGAVPSYHYSSGGAGIGTTSPQQDFKAMLRARHELQKRWKNGKASAIYLEGHYDSIYCVQFDEDKITTGSRDRTIRIWDSRTYKCLRLLGIPNRDSVSTRLDLRTQGEGEPGRPIKILIPRQEALKAHAATAEFCHTGSVLCLQYDNEILVSGSSDSTCIVWDIKNDYQPLRWLRGHATGVLDICFDNRHIVSCSKDTTIQLWDRRSGEPLLQLSGHRGPVNAVQLRGDLIVSASGDGVARLWNIASGQCIKEFPSRDRGMACVDFSLDSRYILAGGNDRVVYHFDASSGTLVREMAGHHRLVRSLHLDNTNGRIISGSYDRSVRAYDYATGELITAFADWTTSWILSAKSDYRRIVAASQDSRVVIMDFGLGIPNIDLLAA